MTNTRYNPLSETLLNHLILNSFTFLCIIVSCFTCEVLEPKIINIL